MPAIVYYCKVLRAIILVTKFGQSLMQGRLPAFGWYFEVFRFEVEFIFEQVS